MFRQPHPSTLLLRQRPTFHILLQLFAPVYASPPFCWFSPVDKTPLWVWESFWSQRLRGGSLQGEGCMMYPFYADKWWHWRSTSLMWAVLCTQGFQVLDLEQCFVGKVLLYQLLAEGYTQPLPSIDPSLHAHNRADFVLQQTCVIYSSHVLDRTLFN